MNAIARALDKLVIVSWLLQREERESRRENGGSCDLMAALLSEMADLSILKKKNN